MACAMTGRNCVAIDRNPVCCKGMVYRMQMLNHLPGPNAECGEAGVCVDSEPEEEVVEQAEAGQAEAGQAGQAPSPSDKEEGQAGQACSDKDDDDFTVNNKPARQPGALVN